MGDTFGDALRELRQRAGLSLADLARRISYSKEMVAKVEAGSRRPTTVLAEACDRTFGTRGLFADLLLADQDGDAVRRRQVVAALNIVAAGALHGPGLAESLRASILAAIGVDDWPDITDEYGRRFMTDAPSEFLAALSGDLLTLRQSLAEPGTSAGWLAAPRLMTLYGMALANQGDVQAAARWYRSARLAADCTQDAGLRQWVRGRAAFRRGYEGATPDEVLHTALGVADVEAYLAVAQAYARVGEPRKAIDALAQAYQAQAAGDQSETTIYAMPGWRMALSAAYVHALLGDVGRCDDGLAGVTPPATVKRWEVQLELQRAVAVARAGDVAGGQSMAAGVLRASPEDQKSTVVMNMWREIEI